MQMTIKCSELKDATEGVANGALVASYLLDRNFNINEDMLTFHSLVNFICFKNVLNVEDNH